MIDRAGDDENTGVHEDDENTGVSDNNIETSGVQDNEQQECKTTTKQRTIQT